MLGDNIYHKDEQNQWVQEDSHHSNPDGSPNLENLERDTGRTNQVLVSNYFFYFGRQAITVDLESMNYKRIRNFKKIKLSESIEAKNIITSIINQNKRNSNLVVSDPCQFMDSHQRVDQGSGKIV